MNDLVKWNDELAKYAKEVASIERPALSQISTRAGQLVYQGQPIPGNKLPCVVIASAFENRYYDKPFDPINRAAPKCFALSLDDPRNMVPHPDVPQPQHENCDGCPMYKWGSDPRGGKGKACKQVRRLALLPVGALLEGNVKTAEIALISIPVTSAKNWANYVNNCAAEYSRPPWALITEITTQPDAKAQFLIKFQTKGLVGDEYLGDVQKRIETVNQILLTPYDMAGNIDGSYPGEEANGKAKKY